MEEARQYKKKLKFMIIGIVIALFCLFGVTYAFFNYTKTGSANTIRVGRIAFSTNQTETIGLTNAFPISRSTIGTDSNNTDEAVITITGDTTYENGIEYLVTATDVHNTIGSRMDIKRVPISIEVTASNGVGTLDNNYFTNRGSGASSHLYKVLTDEIFDNDEKILVGYIKNSSTGINGTITIKAFLDQDWLTVSDTYNGLETDEYGTTSDWVNNRVLLTSNEWNALNTNGFSFKIKIEANENVWVDTISDSLSQYFRVKQYNKYAYNSDRTAADITACVNFLQENGYDSFLEPGETLNAFCAGTGNLSSFALEEALLDMSDETINGFLRSNVIKYVGKGIAIEDYDTAGGTDVIIPDRLPLTTYSYNTNRTASDVQSCLTYVSDGTHYSRWLKTGETLSAFCEGTGTIDGETLEEWANKYFLFDRISLFQSMHIINASVSTKKYPVTEIRSNVFKGKNITSVKLPRDIEFIGVSAFSNNQLTQVTIINDMFEVGVQAFSNNANLTQIVVPDSMYSKLEYNCNGTRSYTIADVGVTIINTSGTQSCTVVAAGS